MDEPCTYRDVKMINDQNYPSLLLADEIFQAFVDVIIPRTPALAEEFGRIQYYGALDLYTDEYLVMTLNNLYTPVAIAVADILQGAAEQFTASEGPNRNTDFEIPVGRAFEALMPRDRLWIITLLGRFAADTGDMPVPFQHPGSIQNITNALNNLTLLGYYSEWSGYGDTRLNAPDRRRLEYFPLSWEQVGYPGPSLGYRALRVNNSR